MKKDILMRVLAVSLGVSCLAVSGFATTWYVNDADTTLDVYCSAAGNDANDGQSKATPKLSVTAVTTSELLQPGDTLYIDTGRYELGTGQNVFTRSGTEEARITVRGSTNGTYLSRSGNNGMSFRTSYADFFDLKLVGSGYYVGLVLDPSAYCSFTRVDVLIPAQRTMTFSPGSYSNQFSHGVIAGSSVEAIAHNQNNVWGNAFHSMVVVGRGGGINCGRSDFLSKFENNVVKVAGTVFPGNIPGVVFSGNVLSGSQMAPGCVTLSDLVAAHPDVCVGNIAGDPLFVNEAKGDYHLQSPYGYWKAETNANGYVTGGAWVTDAAMGMSPGVDFGYDNEFASYTNEPSPNGGRVNAGAYGGTEFASKGHPDGEKWLYAASYNDGGNLIGSGVFEWRAGGFAAGEKVKLQYTHDGTHWSNIVSSVNANVERYAWTVPAGANGAWTMWRVMTTNKTGWIASTNATAFSIRGADDPSIAYYVNDASRVGDVYCKEVGSDENTGADPSHPKASLKSVLDTYQLLPGDVVYVDTGVYEDNDGTNYWTTTLSALDGGSTNGVVTIQGSTNGTVFAGTSKSRDVMAVSGAFYDVRDITVTGGRYGVVVTGASNRLATVTATDNEEGIRVNATGNALERVTAWKNRQYGVYVAGGQGTTLDHSVVWENGTAAVWGVATNLLISNSVLGGSEGTVLGGEGIPSGDWNVAKAADGMSGSRADLASLLAVAPAGTWGHTVVRDPGFVDAANGDFHLAAGSPAIDAGDPSADVGAEPSPNGGRVNVGLYGGTAEAATSGTGAWLQLLSFVDGGTLDASVPTVIRWDAGNLPAGATLTLWLKRSAGGAWEALATGLDAASGAYEFWKEVEGNTSSLTAFLKLTLDGNEKVSSETETAMRYVDGSFPYYVNDASTEGDVYCTAPGSADGDGLSPDTPMLSLEALLSKYKKFSAGDTIYVDTGTYSTNRTAWVINDNMPGTEEKPIRIIGSANAAAGGSVIGNRGTRYAVGLSIGAEAGHVEISNLTFVNVQGNAVTVSNANHITLDGVQVRGATGAGISVLGQANNVTVKHSAATGCGTGLSLGRCTDAAVEQCVFADNTLGVDAAANSAATLVNSALSAERAGQVLYRVATGSFQSDYNGVHAGGNARVSAGTDDLRAWQVASGLDAHSVPGNPLFADEGAFDYHLMTTRTLGRWLDDGRRMTDAESSPLLCAGKPREDGTRPNIGMHGDTARASLPPAGEWLRAVSFNDAGGVGAETNVPLRWVASEAMSNRTVKVEVSGNGGKTWKSVKTKVKATAGDVAWNVGTTADTPAGLWRVTSEADASVTDTCDEFFAVRKAPLKIYVATGDTNETCYVKGPGKADNWEATAAAPLNSLKQALERYDLEGGDTVYVDRGVYAEAEALSLSRKVSGQTNNPVRIVGSTNHPMRDTVLSREARLSGSVVVDLSAAEDIRFESLGISNGWFGVKAENSRGVVFDQVAVVHCASNAVRVGEGATVAFSHGLINDFTSFGVHVHTGGVAQVENSYVQSASGSLFSLGGGRLEAGNNIFRVSGLGNAVYLFQSEASRVAADYNNIHAESGASVADGSGRSSSRFLYDWQQASGGTDGNSSGYDPMMADESNGDYHLRSKAGRYDPTARKFVTTDKETSPLIDLGNPVTGFAAEPMPNGGRVNVGMHGGTKEASKSSSAGRIIPLTMSDGGVIRGDVRLSWTFSTNFAMNQRVNVLFSGDGWKTTNVIASGIYINSGHESDGARSGYVDWNSTNVLSTGMGSWRVELANNPGVYGQTETLFAVKNDPLTYYVNDGSTNGDVYCKAKGLATNDGISPETPMDSLERVFGQYKLEPGDTVYVDTGVYRKSGSVVLNPGFGADTNWLVIQGSTNWAGGGTVLTNEGAGAVLELRGMASMKLHDMVLWGGTYGLQFSQSSANEIRRVASDGATANAFDLGIGSTGNRFVECAALNFGRTGLVMRTVLRAEDPISTNFWDHGVFVTREHGTNVTPAATGICVAATSGRFYVSNTVFQLNASLDTAIDTRAGGYMGDYNAFHLARKGGAIGKWTLNPAPTFGILQKRASQLSGWQALSGQDGNSVYGDPLWGNAHLYDFHPQSTGGRWDAAAGKWVEDKDVSVLVGTGAGGGNIGWYADGAEASKVPANGWLTPLTFRDGGTATGTTTLRWKPLGNVQGNAIVQLITNGAPMRLGTVEASSGAFNWDTKNTKAEGVVQWRLVLQTNTYANDGDIMIRNAPLTYYVNDDSREGDEWCSAVGASTNTGLSANSPMSSLSELLERYDLEAGDEVRIDAGTYKWGGRMTLEWEDSGEPGNPVVIRGAPHAKTIIEGTPMEIVQAQGVCLQNLWFANASAAGGVSVTRGENIRLSGVDVVGSRWNALQVQLSSNVWADHCLFAKALTNGVSSQGNWGLGLDFCTVCSNGAAQVSVQAQWAGNTSSNLLASWMGVSNSILAVAGTRIPIYDVRGNLFADHNDLHATDGGLVALTHEGAMATERGSVNAWYNYNGQDSKSLSYEPGFASARYDDFHLKSTAGRYDPNADAYVTTDTETSALVDAADSTADFGKEPAPNGGRANLGRYGGTDEASKTPAGGGLALVALNDGGKASGNAFPITWLARGDTTNATLSISYWNGSGWQVLTNGVPAANEVWYWDTTRLDASVQGKLKLETSDGFAVENEIPFAVRNEWDRFLFYVNDNSREGDEYCTAVGQNTNDGLTKGTPMADLNALLAKYDLESGDVVYVDTGRYLSGIQPWRITQGDSAAVEGKAPVVIQGATNRLFNGTVLDRQGNAVGISADYTVGLKIRNIAVSNASEVAFSLANTYETSLEWCTARNQGTGASISGGSKAEISHCAFLDVETGVSASGSSLGADATVVLVGPVLQHNLLRAWGSAVVSLAGNWATKVNHCVLIPSTGETYVYSVGVSTPLAADYNAIWTGWGGRVSEQKKDLKDSPVSVVCETVGAWVNLTGNDAHSYDADPGFADYAGEDFHLKSRGGRYNLATKKFVKDTETSALVDAGDPDGEIGEEQSENGGRVNIGLYGGTREASKSDGTGRYNLLTYNNGGVASGRVKLAWNALGSAAGSTVRIEVSLDGGATWPVKVGDGIPADSGEVVWNSENAGASPLAKWRVVDEEPDTAKAVPTQESEKCFILHNSGIDYYVNDGLWESGDYCTAAGDDANDGLSPATPKRNLEAILDAYNLEPGDVVYVDGGTYMREEAVTVGDLDSGSVGRGAARVRIQGQTNETSEKSVFVMLNPEADGIVLDGAYGVALSHLEFVEATNAIRADKAFFIDGEWLTMRDGYNGVAANASSNLWLRHSLFRCNRNAGVHFTHNQMGTVDVESSVFWSNRYGIFLYQGNLSASNNIYGVFGKESFAYYQQTDQNPRGLQSDYNGFHLVGGHADGNQTGGGSSARTSLYSRVSTWATRMGQDTHSLSQDPRFVDPDHGDFHLKSVNGHWGGSGKGWVLDSESSPMIDAGGPTSTGWLAEPDPNGRKLNIGLYGGTARASKTPQSGWLTPLTLVDGGSEAGDIELCWQAGGAATNDTVTIEFSYDNGVSWTNTIVSGWPATEGAYVWKSGDWGATALGQWRIYSDRDQSIVGGSYAPFVLRNTGTIPYYVNNDLEEGDVYCTAAGDDENDGLTPATPKATVQAILAAYELEPEDVILVDAGRYVDGAYPIVVDGTDSGWSNRYVTIQGSTNPAARTIWHAPSRSEAVCSLSYAENVCLRNLTLENANVGVLFDHAINCRLEDVRVERNPQVGVSLVESEGTELLRTLLWKNVSTTGGVAVAFQNSGANVDQCVVWGSQKAISVGNGGTISISNSVLDARSEIGRIYSFGATYNGTNFVSADYNAYHLREGAIVGEQANQSGGNDLYKDLLSWSEASGNDRHSLMGEPGFWDSEGVGDFHLLSPAGRFTTNDWYETTNHWVEGYGTTWSPLIDAGNPQVEVIGEPEPNGGVVNIGIYGNTPEASKTPTNPPWVRAMSYNTAGTITKTALLYWNFGGQDSGQRVTLEYRRGYEMEGQPWVAIATNVPLERREYEWDVSALPLTLALKWRISVEGTGYSDESDAYVAVKTKNYDYYVNDLSTVGDAYCKGVGQPYGEGVGTNALVPIDSFTSLLEHYPVGAGDRVFIDTGTYELGTNVVLLTADNMGTDGFPLEIIGSTNFIAGGSTFRSDGTTNGIILQNTRRISLSNLRVSGAKHGVALLNVSDIELDGMDIRENGNSGIYVNNGANVSVRRSLLADNGEYGVHVASAPTGSRSLENVTLADNGKGAIFTVQGVQLDNSILVGGISNTLIALSGSAASVGGDYNLFQWGTGGGLATNNLKKQHMTNVKQWQEQSGGDQHSFRADPLFVDAAGGDYHVKSRAGCWSNGAWTKAEATSWAIDGGNPGADWQNERPSTGGNGGRVNLGAYGGGPQASATDASKPELLVMALTDGGVAGQSQILTWASRGISDNAVVRLEYSPDNGQTWQLIGTAKAGDGNTGYEWISTWTPSPLAQWRVVLAGNTNVFGQTGTNFTFRPSRLIYYVNDDSREGDVFTTAVGSAANNGYQANSPLDSVAAVLARYQLSEDDELCVDTGVYELGESVEWTGLNAGSGSTNVLFRGSTNLARKTVFMPSADMADVALKFAATHDVEVRDMTFAGFSNAIAIPQYNERIFLSDLELRESEGAAVSVEQASGVKLSRVLVRDGYGDGLSFSQTKPLLDGCVVWGNAGNAISMGQGVELSVTNSILSANGFGNYCYYASTTVVIRADYNNLFVQDAGQVASIDGVQYDKVPQWMRATSQDIHSLSTDPLFADAENGDFHVRSVYGRYDAALGRFVKDTKEAGLADVSPMVDAGNTNSTWAVEPTPNGGRRNIGLYGGTWQASKSDTNAWVTAVTAMSGGLLDGTFYLTWIYGGDVDTNELVRLEYSPRNGEDNTWELIGEARLSQGMFYWTSDLKNWDMSEKWQTSPEARWRIMLADTNVWDATDLPFGLRNKPFSFYLNDGDQTDDVWCTTNGLDIHSGFWPDRPKRTLQSLLENIDVEPTDEILVDTGTYYMGDTNWPVVWQYSDGGESGAPVRLSGSPNGATFVVSNLFAAPAIFSLDADYVAISNIGFRVVARNSQNVTFNGIGLVLDNVTVSNAAVSLNGEEIVCNNLTAERGGVTVAGNGNRVNRLESRQGAVKLLGTNSVMLNSLVYLTNNAATALVVQATSAALTNCTVVAPNGTAVGKTGLGTLSMEGNILVAGGDRRNAALAWKNGGLKSDWNDFYTTGTAWVGETEHSKWEKLMYWQRETGQDAHSLAIDPKFADMVGGDFHLWSKAGRWDRRLGKFVPDAEHSSLIDMGNPQRGTGDEVMPHGDTPNMGAYARTAEASQSVTNFWLLVRTANDGGVLKGSNVVLRWSANMLGAWQNRTVTLQYWDGAEWRTIAGGISARAGEYVWDTTGITNNLFDAKWRVVCDQDGSVFDESDTPFALRNRTADFYLSATGDDGNDGLSTNAPMKTFQALFDKYDLEGGDTVHARAGNYTAETNVLVVWSRSGEEGNPVKIVGTVTTNGTAGVRLGAGKPSVEIHASNFQWDGIRIDGHGVTNGETGVAMSLTRNVELSGMDFSKLGTGIRVDEGYQTTVRNSSFKDTQYGIWLANSRTNTLRNLTMVGIPGESAGIKLVGSDGNVLENNIFKPQAGAYAYEIGSSLSLLTDAAMDYNLYDFGAEGSGFHSGTNYANLRKWQLAMDNDYRSALEDANLENPDKGDFHPQSIYGRWNGKAFTNSDTVTSFAVDHGNPLLPVGAEQKNNGGRINIGRFGGTKFASKGSTNVALGVRSMDEVGLTISSDDPVWPLVWESHLLGTNTTVYVQWKGESGDWTTLAEAKATDEYYLWTMTTANQTSAGRWRIITADGKVVDEADNTFEYTLEKFGFKSMPYRDHGLMRFKWKGALTGRRYVIQYTEDYGKTWQMWPTEYNGPEKIHRSNFVMQPGETQVEYIFEDITSFEKRQRWYRLVEIKYDEDEGGDAEP